MSGTCAGQPPAVAATHADTTRFDNINPNLLPSWKIRVGYQDDSSAVFCLGDGDDCYTDKTIHNTLSRFNLNDYLDPDDDKQEEVPFPSSLSIDDIGTLIVPGMWLECLRQTDPNETYHYHEAMLLTTEQNLLEGHIGIEYGRDDDHDQREKEWVPISWCKVANPPMKPNQCDTTLDASESKCDFVPNDFDDNEYNKAYAALLRRAFNELARMKRDSGGIGGQTQSPGLLSKWLHGGDNEGKVIFSYASFPARMKNKEGFMLIGPDVLSLPLEIDTSVYSAIYSIVPFWDQSVQQLDNKHKLSQLLLEDHKAASVFPKSYSSYKEALLDTNAEHERGGNVAFYIKDSTGARGEGIEIQTWKELSMEYDQLRKEGEYDVDGGEEDVVIQRAVTDLHTVGGDGPISGRRFDIRFYVLVANGSVYVHSNMLFRWSLHGPKYDPTDTKLENQVVNVVAYSGGEMVRLHLADSASEWNINNDKRRRRTDRSIPSEGFDPFGWRDAVADALDEASGVFATLKILTKDDPTKYVFAGGDAMIREDGSAVLVEFNVFPDTAASYAKGLAGCLEGENCRRMIIISDTKDDTVSASYQVTPQSLAHGIVSVELTAEVYRDVISMVMAIQPANEIEKFREIVPRTG